jgi:hypothetical protein
MLDNSSNYSLTSERISHKIGRLDDEEYNITKAEDYCHDSHDQYCLEMFRHAVKESDQCVQRWLQQKFSAILLNWIHDHPKGDLICRLHTEEYYLFETFRCFWLTLRKQQKFDFTSVSDALFYLRISMNGVILDTLRNFSSPREVPLTSTDIAKEVQSNEIYNSYGIWRLIERKLSNERERKMAYLLFQCALKPEEIVDSYPNEFSDENEISLVRGNIMKLLCCGDHGYFTMNKIS